MLSHAFVKLAHMPLKGGMLARVTIQYGAARLVRLVAKDAIVRRGDQEIVFVVDSQAARRRVVVTGRPVDGFLEIADGQLAAGETIVVTGNEALQDGAPVQVVPPAQANAPRPAGGQGGRR